MEDNLKILKFEYLNNPWLVFLKLKPKLGGPNRNQLSLKQRRPLMEDNLKILKVEYLSNHFFFFELLLVLTIRYY